MSFWKRKKVEQKPNLEELAKIEALRAALEKDPDDIDSLFNLGVKLFFIEEYEESNEVLDNVLEKRPDDSEALLKKAKIIHKTQPKSPGMSIYDHFEKALSICDEVINNGGKYYGKNTDPVVENFCKIGYVRDAWILKSTIYWDMGNRVESQNCKLSMPELP